MSAEIQGIYIALFGRPADPAGLAFFNEATNNGADLTAIGDLASTAEYQDRFTGMSNTEIVSLIYLSLFGRDGEPAGVAYWVDKLESGALNINTIAIAFLDGAQGNDLAIVAAKIAAADIFTARLDLDVEIEAYSGAFAAQVGRDFIDSIDVTTPGNAANADTAILRLFPDEGQNPGGGGAGNGGPNLPPPEFVVSELDGKVYFSGDGSGPVTYETADGISTFQRGGLIATHTVDGVEAKEIVLAVGQEIALSGHQASNQEISGEGIVSIQDYTGGNLNKISASGTATVTSDVHVATDDRLSSRVEMIVEAAGKLTLTSEQAHRIQISGAGEVVVNASTAVSEDVISALTDGGNVLNGGISSDIIISGGGNDIIIAGDVTSPTEATNEVAKFDIDDMSKPKNGYAYPTYVSYILTDGGLVAPVMLTFKVGDHLSATIEQAFVAAANAQLGSDFTATWSNSTIQLESVLAGNVTNLTVASLTHQYNWFYLDGFSDSNGKSYITIANENLPGGIKSYLIDRSTNYDILEERLADAVNADPDSPFYAVLSGGSLDLIWKTPGNKGTVTVSAPEHGNINVVHDVGSIASPTQITIVDFKDSSYLVVEASVDILTGGGGQDRFIVTASTLTAIDRITDFNTVDDKIEFTSATDAITFVLHAAGADVATLKESVEDFLAGSVTGKNDAVLFSYKNKDYLLFDGDGNSTFEDGVDQIIDVTGFSGVKFTVDNFV